MLFGQIQRRTVSSTVRPHPRAGRFPGYRLNFVGDQRDIGINAASVLLIRFIRTGFLVIQTVRHRRFFTALRVRLCAEV
ncbi:hypothetical protein D3C73_1392100 [compost metagenome]